MWQAVARERPRVFDYGLETDLLFTDVSRQSLPVYHSHADFCTTASEPLNNVPPRSRCRFVLVFYILFQAYASHALSRTKEFVCAQRELRSCQVYWDFSYAQQKNGVGWKHLVTAQARLRKRPNGNFRIPLKCSPNPEALADAVIVILFIVVFALRMSYLRSVGGPRACCTTCTVCC